PGRALGDPHPMPGTRCCARRARLAAAFAFMAATWAGDAAWPAPNPATTVLSHTYMPWALPGTASAITVADLDGDGHLDVAVFVPAPNVATGGVFVLRGHGDGTFAAPLSYPVGG